MEIELCKQCKGLGTIISSSHEGHLEMFCSNCNSTGKIFKLSFTKEFPFTDDYKDKAKIVKFEEKIAKSIRDEKSN